MRALLCNIPSPASQVQPLPVALLLIEFSILVVWRLASSPTMYMATYYQLISVLYPFRLKLGLEEDRSMFDGFYKVHHISVLKRIVCLLQCGTSIQEVFFQMILCTHPHRLSSPANQLNTARSISSLR